MTKSEIRDFIMGFRIRFKKTPLIRLKRNERLLWLALDPEDEV